MSTNAHSMADRLRRLIGAGALTVGLIVASTSAALGQSAPRDAGSRTVAAPPPPPPVLPPPVLPHPVPPPVLPPPVLPPAAAAAASPVGPVGPRPVDPTAAPDAAPDAAAAPGISGSRPHPSVPPALVPPPGHLPNAVFVGTGVQVYACVAGAWSFVEPVATLDGAALHPARSLTAVQVGGPTWASGQDGSRVEGRVIASAPVPGSIPQLLLEAVRTRGTGIFGKVRYVQQLATSGGAAPAAPCQDGTTTGVPYEATYRFFVPVGG